MAVGSIRNDQITRGCLFPSRKSSVEIEREHNDKRRFQQTNKEFGNYGALSLIEQK